MPHVEYKENSYIHDYILLEESKETGRIKNPWKNRNSPISITKRSASILREVLKGLSDTWIPVKTTCYFRWESSTNTFI